MAWLLELPTEYPYVLAVATASFTVNMYHTILTLLARQKCGIQYPTAYADQAVADKDINAMLFNCAQRAHANFTENLTPFLVQLFVAGLRFPVTSAAFGGGWVLSRAVYAHGYSTKGPEGRRLGSGGNYFFDFSLKLMAAYTSVAMIMGK